MNFLDDKLPPGFWGKCIPEPNSGCWLWIGPLNWDDYGQLRHAGKAYRAHRLSYELLVGPIPDGLTLDHLCRVRNCVNPEHCEPVTPGENTRRGTAAQRAAEIKRALTQCKHGHDLSDARIKSNGTRACRECHRIRSNERHHTQSKRNRDAWTSFEKLDYSAVYRTESVGGESGVSYECYAHGRLVFSGWTRGRRRDAEAEVRRGIANRDALISAAQQGAN